MATEFYTHVGGGRFLLTFETDCLAHYEFVQQAARICVDGQRAKFAPVVRCKDCAKWDSSTHTCDEFTSNRLPQGGRIAFVTLENDFCSYGEREDGANDGE